MKNMMMMMMMNGRKKIGAKIAQYRKECGLSQSELAEKIGTSQIHMSRIETGFSSPNFELVIKIADELRCTPDDFLKE